MCDYNLALLLFATVGATERDIETQRYALHGKIIDDFGDGRILVSIGSEQGARKGFKGRLICKEQPWRSSDVEFVDVAKNHSVVRPFGYYSSSGLKIGESFSWTISKRPFLYPFGRPVSLPPLPAAPPYLNPRIESSILNNGGAFIDLRDPEQRKFFPIPER
jgi:hypothetical protein